MNHKKILIIALLVVVVLSVCIGSASARYPTGASGGENAGISGYDTIYIGEKNLNFSAFATSGKTLDLMAKKENGNILGEYFKLTNMIAGEISVSPGTYYPYYNDGTFGSSVCQVANLDMGTMKIYAPASSGSFTDDHPANIPATLGVIFYMDGGNLGSLISQNPTGSWNEFELINSRTGVGIKEITNTAGIRTSLIGIGNPADKTNTDYEFWIGSQTNFRPDEDTPASMIFRINLNGLQKTVSYGFTAVKGTLSLALDKTEVKQNDRLTLTLTGTPFTSYTLTLSPTDSPASPYFPDGTYTKINNHTIIVTPDWTGKSSVQIVVSPDAPVGSYQVTAKVPDSPDQKTISFRVVSGGMELTFEEPSRDVSDGKFSVGDTIALTGGVNGAELPVPVYLYLTGPNLPANGASLENPGTEVVDGDPSTFTVAYYSPNMGVWTYSWWTRGFEAETYTIHANLKPYGHREGGTPGGAGTGINGKVALSWDYPLSEPSIQVKSSDKSGGYFARGDTFYSWWIARGSPGVTEDRKTSGEIRWYIFGSNFRYADRETHVPLFGADDTLTGSSDTGDVGKIAPWGEYGFTYNRNFTYDLTPGTYYLVYQHPGANNIFDVSASAYGSGMASVSTTYGSSANFEYMQGRAAAEALTNMFEDPKCDDLYVMTQFVVEDPWITFDTVSGVTVGDKLTISGKTNLAAADKTADKTKTEDTLWLTVHRQDLNLVQDTSTAMKIPVSNVIPSSPTPFRGYRTFSYDQIDTSSWYPGTYEVTVTCKDANFKQSYSFELLSPEAKADHTTTEPTKDASLSQNPYPSAEKTPLKTPEPTPVRTSVPLATEAPGFGSLAAFFSLGILFVLFRRR